MLPQLAQGPANKIFIIPSEFKQALGNLGGALSSLGGAPPPKPKSGRNEGADAAAERPPRTPGPPPTRPARPSARRPRPRRSRAYGPA